jgi:hypothetical protein
MAIVVNPEPGIVLIAEFDRNDPSAQDEVQQFSARLEALQRQQGFEAFVPIMKQDGSRLSISIVPCALNAPGSVRDAAALGLSRDSFKGSGRLQPAKPAGPDPYANTGPLDAGALSDGWFTDEQ